MEGQPEYIRLGRISKVCIEDIPRLLISVLALTVTVILRGQLSLFWQRSTIIVVGAFPNYLQILATKMGTPWDKMLKFQELDDRALYLVWVTELYRIASTFITLLIPID